MAPGAAWRCCKTPVISLCAPDDDNARAGLPDYHHWTAAAELRRGRIGFEIAYHDTSLPPGTFFPSGPRVVGRATAYFGK